MIRASQLQQIEAENNPNNSRQQNKINSNSTSNSSQYQQTEAEKNPNNSNWVVPKQQQKNINSKFQTQQHLNNNLAVGGLGCGAAV